jgi:hypothetical protein
VPVSLSVEVSVAGERLFRRQQKSYYRLPAR